MSNINIDIPTILRSFDDHLCNVCLLNITDTPESDLCFQVNFHIQGISAEYANSIYKLIYEFITKDEVVNPNFVF